MALTNGVRATVIFEFLHNQCTTSPGPRQPACSVNRGVWPGPFPSGSIRSADLNSHRGVRLGTYWARNAKGLREETAFPLVGVHMGVVGLTGLELANRLRRQWGTVGDYPGQSGIY